MLRVGCFVLLVGVVLGLELKAQLNNQWQKFKSTHGKKYSGAEEGKRQEIFKNNVESILQHNLGHDLGEADFTQGVNEFSDMSHEEFVKTMCGAKSSRPPTHNSTMEVFTPTERASLPTTVDWRNQNIVGPVKNQGSCGSCWAFSTTGAIESAWAKAKGQLVVLSEQQLVDCSRLDDYDCDGCDGGWPYEAMRYVVENNGQDKQQCYTYRGIQNAQCQYQSSCKGATISKFVKLPEGSESALQEAVATAGPVSVCLDAGQPDFQSYRRGIYNPSYCSQEINHAVLMVGYGTEGGKDYWLVKNSWGTSWGDQGYFKLARNAKNKCGISNVSSYPIV